MLTVPFAGEEVLQAIGLEADGAVDESVLVRVGVVPERVRIPERDVRRQTQMSKNASKTLFDDDDDETEPTE